MININKLKIETIQGRIIIDELTFSLNEGDKLAIIGEEGNGKSTLLKAIFDQKLIDNYCIISGTVDRGDKTIGYLEQKLDIAWSEQSVIDYFVKDHAETEPIYDRYENLHTLQKILSVFQLRPDLFESDVRVGNLSGGEQVKLQLAKLTWLDFDVLLLDEPTNDLDISTLLWLEEFITKSAKAIMFISHDETLLENVSNTILHIEQLKRKTESKCTYIKLGYAEYAKIRSDNMIKQTQIGLKQRAEYEAQQAKFQQILNKVDYQQATISRQDPHGGKLLKKKMKSLKSQEARFEKEKTDFVDIPSPEEAIKIIVDEKISLPNSKMVLNIENEILSIADKLLSENITLKIFGAEKIALIGNNGSGKTTLLKFILPKLKITAGLKIGYFSQNYFESLDFNKTPVQELDTLNDNSVKSNAKQYTQINPRTLLGSLKFTEEEMNTKIQYLSEGQKAKLLLVKNITEGNNVLVLDEPTRNLSPLSNPVLRGILRSYNGCIIAVSHDRKFIKEICDKVYELTKDGLNLIEL